MCADLWSFALSTYARPGVEAACLRVQEQGADVCLLLCGAWLEQRGVALTRELNFVVEWLLVAGLMMAMLLTYRLVFAIAFLPQPGFGFALLQILWSMLCYPAVVMASRLALDLRKPATGEVDAMGRRL